MDQRLKKVTVDLELATPGSFDESQLNDWLQSWRILNQEWDQGVPEWPVLRLEQTFTKSIRATVLNTRQIRLTFVVNDRIRAWKDWLILKLLKALEADHVISTKLEEPRFSVVDISPRDNTEG